MWGSDKGESFFSEWMLLFERGDQMKQSTLACFHTLSSITWLFIIWHSQMSSTISQNRSARGTKAEYKQMFRVSFTIQAKPNHNRYLRLPRRVHDSLPIRSCCGESLLLTPLSLSLARSLILENTHNSFQLLYCFVFYRCIKNIIKKLL